MRETRGRRLASSLGLRRQSRGSLRRDSWNRGFPRPPAKRNMFSLREPEGCQGVLKYTLHKSQKHINITNSSSLLEIFLVRNASRHPNKSLCISSSIQPLFSKPYSRSRFLKPSFCQATAGDVPTRDAKTCGKALTFVLTGARASLTWRSYDTVICGKAKTWSIQLTRG